MFEDSGVLLNLPLPTIHFTFAYITFLLLGFYHRNNNLAERQSRACSFWKTLILSLSLVLSCTETKLHRGQFWVSEEVGGKRHPGRGTIYGIIPPAGAEKNITVFQSAARTKRTFPLLSAKRLAGYAVKLSPPTHVGQVL